MICNFISKMNFKHFIKQTNFATNRDFSAGIRHKYTCVGSKMRNKSFSYCSTSALERKLAVLTLLQNHSKNGSIASFSNIHSRPLGSSLLALGYPSSWRTAIICFALIFLSAQNLCRSKQNKYSYYIYVFHFCSL